MFFIWTSASLLTMGFTRPRGYNQSLMKCKKVSVLSTCAQLVLVASFTQLGCERKTPAFVHRLVEIRASDLSLVFKNQEPLRVAKSGVPVKIERVVGEDKLVKGYVEEQRYQVENDPETSEVQLFMVYDRRWLRRGFVTESGKAFRYDASGMAKPISNLDFTDGLEILLELKGEYRLETYDPLNPPAESKLEPEEELAAPADSL